MRISDLPNGEFKITVIKMLIEVKRTIHEQTENFKEEIKYFLKYQTNYRAEKYNNCTKKFNREVQQQNEVKETLNFKTWQCSASNLQSEKKRRIKTVNISLREFWDTIKGINLHGLRVPEEERKKGTESLFREIMGENSTELGKETDI